MIERREPIVNAILKNDLDRLKTLITPDNVNNLYGRFVPKTPLCIAVKSKKTDIVTWLILHGGADVNAPSTTLTPIFYARTVEMIALLANAGADMNYVATASEFATPIMHATYHNRLALVHALIHHGAVLASSLHDYNAIKELPLYVVRRVQGRELCRQAARTLTLCVKRTFGMRDLANRLGRQVWSMRSDEEWEEACQMVSYVQRRKE